MKLVILFIFLLLSFGLVFADTISDTTVIVKIQNNTLNITNTVYSGNNKLVLLNVTNTTIQDIDFSFPILFIKNESVDISTVDKYVSCVAEKESIIGEKNQFNMGWNICKADLENCKSENNQSTKDQLNSCNIDRQRIQIELDAKASRITELESEQKGKFNSIILFVVIALIVGFVARMFYDGKLLTQAKDKQRDEFNPQRAS